jgi:hypothetical protein
MSKLTKTLIVETLTSLVAANPAMFKSPVKAQEFVALVQAAFTSSTAQDKINAAGEVYCNYFDMYLPGDQFKLNSKGKYKANCMQAEQIIRKVRNLKHKEEEVLLKMYRQRKIIADELEVKLAGLEAFYKQPYSTVAEIGSYLA